MLSVKGGSVKGGKKEQKAMETVTYTATYTITVYSDYR